LNAFQYFGTHTHLTSKHSQNDAVTKIVLRNDHWKLHLRSEINNNNNNNIIIIIIIIIYWNEFSLGGSSPCNSNKLE